MEIQEFFLIVGEKSGILPNCVWEFGDFPQFYGNSGNSQGKRCSNLSLEFTFDHSLEIAQKLKHPRFLGSWMLGRDFWEYRGPFIPLE